MIIDKFIEWKSSLPTQFIPEQESALSYHVIECADHLTPNAIARHIISPATAWGVVSADDDMGQTVLSCNPAPKDLAYISKLAYMLAYEKPELATQLLDELLYYRNQSGRI